MFWLYVTEALYMLWLLLHLIVSARYNSEDDSLEMETNCENARRGKGLSNRCRIVKMRVGRKAKNLCISKKAKKYENLSKCKKC